MNVEVLVFEVIFVADDNCLDFIVRIVLNLEEPLVEILEAVTFSEVENQEGSD